MKYKIGDKVKIIKPNKDSDYWLVEMNDTIGNEVILDDTDGDDCLPWSIDGYWYREEWLELVDNSNGSYDHAMGIV